MKQIIASVFSDILSYTIGNIVYYIIKFWKNQSTLTYNCQRNGQKNNEITIFKKNWFGHFYSGI